MSEGWCEEVAEDGPVSCESVVRGQAVGIAPAERLKLRRHTAGEQQRHERVCFLVAFRGGGQFGGHPPWSCSLGQKVCGGEDGKPAIEGVEEADL